MIKNLTPLLLRLSLALIFLFAAIDGFLAPQDWVGYLPHFLTTLLPATTLLKIFEVYELLLAVWLLSGIWVRYAAILSALTLGGIVVSNLNLVQITFRDMALMLAALALAASTWHEKPNL